MKKEDLQEFENKNIKIILNTGFTYNGEIISLAEDHLKFYDRFLGRMLITYEDIRVIRLNEGSK